jgi:hypothetical protein
MRIALLLLAKVDAKFRHNFAKFRIYPTSDYLAGINCISYHNKHTACYATVLRLFSG